MIGLIVNYIDESVETYNPHIQNNQTHFDLETFKMNVELSALHIANQLNNKVSTLDLANVKNITLTMNNNEVVYLNSQTENIIP